MTDDTRAWERPDELPRWKDVESLRAVRDVVYAVDRDLTLAFCNDAWYGFAADNGGEPAISSRWAEGRDVREALPEVLLPYYETAYRACLRDGRPWDHEFECSSPETKRLFHQCVMPLRDGDGLVIVNALRSAVPMDRHAEEPSDAYRNDDGIVAQCCHCRRIRHARDSGRWDWVPDWIRNPPRAVSHGICETCLTVYYPTG